MGQRQGAAGSVDHHTTVSATLAVRRRSTSRGGVSPAGRRPRATLRLSHQSSSSSPSIHHRVTPVTMCQFSFCQFSSFRNSALTECTPTAATPAEAPTPSECLMRQDWIMLLHAWSISSSDPTIITRSMGIASSVLVGVWPLGGISHTFAAGAFTFSLFES